MVWQDIVITIINVVFGYALIPQVWKGFKDKTDKLISHKADASFLALALELNTPIWSNDEHFKERNCSPF